MTDQTPEHETPDSDQKGHHAGGGIIPRKDATEQLATDLHEGRRVIYTMVTPRTIDAVEVLPAPYTIYLDDGQQDLLVVNGGCKCAVSMLWIFAMAGPGSGILMITLPVETDLSEFGEVVGMRPGNTPQPHHRYVDVGMKNRDGSIAFPTLLMKSIRLADPDAWTMIEEAQTRTNADKSPAEIKIQNMRTFLGAMENLT